MDFPIQSEALTVVNTFSWNLAHADAEFDAISDLNPSASHSN